MATFVADAQVLAIKNLINLNRMKIENVTIAGGTLGLQILAGPLHGFNVWFMML
jgi:hypothetical protein